MQHSYKVEYYEHNSEWTFQDFINDKAREGWKLLSVDKGTYSTQLIFERKNT